MSDKIPPSPEAPPPASSTPRQRTIVYIGCGLLLTYALVLLAVPTPKLSFSLRAILAAVNLIAASVLWLATRQHTPDNSKSPKP